MSACSCECMSRIFSLVLFPLYSPTYLSPHILPHAYSPRVCLRILSACVSTCSLACMSPNVVPRVCPRTFSSVNVPACFPACFIRKLFKHGPEREGVATRLIGCGPSLRVDSHRAPAVQCGELGIFQASARLCASAHGRICTRVYTQV